MNCLKCQGKLKYSVEGGWDHEAPRVDHDPVWEGQQVSAMPAVERESPLDESSINQVTAVGEFLRHYRNGTGE